VSTPDLFLVHWNTDPTEHHTTWHRILDVSWTPITTVNDSRFCYTQQQ